jgi:hypothetical protein
MKLVRWTGDTKNFWYTTCFAYVACFDWLSASVMKALKLSYFFPIWSPVYVQWFCLRRLFWLVIRISNEGIETVLLFSCLIACVCAMTLSSRVSFATAPLQQLLPTDSFLHFPRQLKAVDTWYKTRRTTLLVNRAGRFHLCPHHAARITSGLLTKR